MVFFSLTCTYTVVVQNIRELSRAGVLYQQRPERQTLGWAAAGRRAGRWKRQKQKPSALCNSIVV